MPLRCPLSLYTDARRETRFVPQNECKPDITNLLGRALKDGGVASPLCHRFTPSAEPHSESLDLALAEGGSHNPWPELWHGQGDSLNCAILNLLKRCGVRGADRPRWRAIFNIPGPAQRIPPGPRCYYQTALSYTHRELQQNPPRRVTLPPEKPRGRWARGSVLWQSRSPKTRYGLYVSSC